MRRSLSAALDQRGGKAIMVMTRFLAAVGFTLSFLLFASPASAKDLLWYTARSCQFYPGGGHRTTAETAESRRHRDAAAHVLKLCSARTHRDPLPHGRYQSNRCAPLLSIALARSLNP